MHDSNSSILSPKILIITIITLAFLLAAPISLWAAGGGGGGGSGSVPPPPACESDTWNCGSWTSCNLSGQQSRTCNLSFDCPTANDPRPEEARTCTPPCTEDVYNCTDWNTCNTSGKQNRTCAKTTDCPLVETPKPVEEQSCEKTSPAATKTPVPTCLTDEYQCGGWSQCGENGKQSRDCTLKRDCPSINTPKPLASQICPGLRCGQLPALGERISCRLKLTDEQLASEFKILFMPEVCKIFMDDPEEKKECIRMYQNFGPCWKLPAGIRRNDCARKSLDLGGVAEEKATCLVLQGQEEKECLSELKEKVKYMTIFRMYDLENRAEAVLGQGDYLELVEAFDLFIEERKQELYKSENVAEWRKILQKVQEGWKNFIRDKKAKK